MFINNFDPVAFQVFSLEIRWYSLAYIFGILLGWHIGRNFFLRDNNLKQKFLESSDVFVMPSYKVNESIEGFGISYIEAAAFRIPSIAGLDGGVTDAVIDSKTGWCVDPLNQDQLANVLKDAINNKDLRQKYGLHAEKQFLQRFLGEKVFRKFMDTISI